MQQQVAQVNFGCHIAHPHCHWALPLPQLCKMESGMQDAGQQMTLSHCHCYIVCSLLSMVNDGDGYHVYDDDDAPFDHREYVHVDPATTQQ